MCLCACPLQQSENSPRSHGSPSAMMSFLTSCSSRWGQHSRCEIPDSFLETGAPGEI
ncbi:hypothetical protein LEMLEM_LOCUS1516 [Lemmus lemmus]